MSTSLCFLCLRPSLNISAHQPTGLSAPATTAAATTAASAEPEKVPSASASQAAARPTAGEHDYVIYHNVQCDQDFNHYYCISLCKNTVSITLQTVLNGKWSDRAI